MSSFREMPLARNRSAWRTSATACARFPIVLALALTLAMTLALAGCSPQMMTDDTDIQAKARGWPQYRAPHLDASANLNIWPGQVSPERQARARRGKRPELDRPMPVIQSHRYWNLEETAVDALARIGEPAVEELVKALRSDEPRVRYQAAQVLGRIGPGADAAVSALVRTMEDPEPQVQKAAARALGQIGPDAGQAVRSLMRVIQSESTSAGDRRPTIEATP